MIKSIDIRQRRVIGWIFLATLLTCALVMFDLARGGPTRSAGAARCSDAARRCVAIPHRR